MSNYARANTGGATHFTDKDALTSGDSNKVIVGSQFDSEFNAILTAVNSKYDSDDLASEAEAQGESLNTKIITPLRLQSWSASNSAVLDGLHAISGLAAGGDKLFFFDDTDDVTKALTIGTGIAITGTTIATDDGAIVHDSLSGFVANEHIDHSTVSITAGNGLTGTGTIDANVTLNVVGNNGLTAAADSIGLTNVSASTTQAITVTSGTFALNLGSLTTLAGNSVEATDRFLVWDASAGNVKAVQQQQAGLRVDTVTSTANKTFTDAEVNQVWVYNAATDATWDIDTGLGEVGDFIIMVQQGVGSIDLGGGTATINNEFSHDTSRAAWGVMTLVCVATNTWVLYGATAAS